MRRARTAFAVQLLLLLVLTGCNSGADEVKAQRATTDGIQAKLAERADVATAKVVYQDNFTASRVAAASIMLESGSDPGPVADEAVRLIWLSSLSPLNMVSVDVADAGDRQNNEVRSISFEDAVTRASLEGRYGPRPAR